MWLEQDSKKSNFRWQTPENLFCLICKKLRFRLPYLKENTITLDYLHTNTGNEI